MMCVIWLIVGVGIATIWFISVDVIKDIVQRRQKKRGVKYGNKRV